jgi:hypothetical protein
MTAILAALIAMAGAVAVGFVTQFVAEDYRRFRDGSALAAGLAGELSSYAPAFPMLQEAIQGWIAAITTGKRDLIPFRPIDRPVDLFFEEVVGKLGLLGASTVEGVVYVYSNLRAFRMAMEMVVSANAEMTNDELSQRCTKCLEALQRASERGIPLVAALKLRAQQRFQPRWPWSARSHD